MLSLFDFLVLFFCVLGFAVFCLAVIWLATSPSRSAARDIARRAANRVIIRSLPPRGGRFHLWN